MARVIYRLRPEEQQSFDPSTESEFFAALREGDSGKFVLFQEEGARDFLAVFGPSTSGGYYYHAELADSVSGVVRGGGHYERRGDSLRLYGKSEKYGACDEAQLEAPLTQ